MYGSKRTDINLPWEERYLHPSMDPHAVKASVRKTELRVTLRNYRLGALGQLCAVN